MVMSDKQKDLKSSEFLLKRLTILKNTSESRDFARGDLCELKGTEDKRSCMIHKL